MLHGECKFLVFIRSADNVVSKPNDEKTHTIRVKNPNFSKKVGEKSSGISFLEACGFTFYGFSSDEKLLDARRILIGKAVHLLSMSKDDFPKLCSPTTTCRKKQPPFTSSFDPFKKFSYNTQAASHGLDATNQVSRILQNESKYVSPIEQELSALESKKHRIKKYYETNESQ